ncbi:hypothetical protein G7Y89_g12477 [Cudoniella acicularis]|uniref:DDE-1 domain-containing protein n=1 Tax=Cudoniella acicularis TaxID=354080 RepID=A0A8H4R912_9HELO|nr:hypothetical protein G7Y89_g12477 [Cudoniella acicularis]
MKPFANLGFCEVSEASDLIIYSISPRPPLTREQANQKPRVLICDGFRTHETLEAQEFCFENNIIHCRLPSHTSHKLQPCDAACGIFPLNPDRVLRVTPKPPAQSTIPRADEIRDAHTLNETSIPRLKRHVQKLVDAAQVSIAETALLRDEKQLLARMNNKAKVRRSAKSLVLGQAKVMSFEDIVVARAERTAKDVKVKGKRGRKRKSAALEPDEPEADEPEPESEPEPEVARAVKEVIEGRGKSSRKRKTAAQEADEPEPEPEVARTIETPVWRAPVAQMI